ncbi:hypothetical protein [Flagellimonas olearia]|uniref:Uncharacterized protein n=1 Tax=Flagellimonas olearia TaxID=552546 RepID=A0A444VMC1_9FLAO|nr:hypothetical protein [Allomuricauda olearia]RYC51904.1 hypothetical protein DN53_08440 [Allomuricauda olearia]
MTKEKIKQSNKPSGMTKEKIKQSNKFSGMTKEKIRQSNKLSGMAKEKDQAKQQAFRNDTREKIRQQNKLKKGQGPLAEKSQTLKTQSWYSIPKQAKTPHKCAAFGFY